MVEILQKPKTADVVIVLSLTEQFIDFFLSQMMFNLLST